MEKSFSKENTATLRAVAAVIIIFTHLNRTMPIRPENPLLFLSQFANLAVSLFYYYTGYNLFNNYKSREDCWYQQFWLKKICRIYLPFFLMNIAIQLLWWLQGKGPNEPFTIILCAIGYYLLNPDVWYIQSCLIFYLLFYIIFRALRLIAKRNKINDTVILFFGIIMVLAYNVIYRKVGAYKENISLFPTGFVLGMMVAIFGERIYPFWKKNKWELFFILMFAAVTIPIYIKNQIRVTSWIGERDFLTNLHHVVLLIMANTLLIGEQIDSKLFRFIDKYSLNLYISHSFFYTVFRSELIYIKSDLLYLIIYIISIFAAAFVLNRISENAYRVTGRIMT